MTRLILASLLGVSIFFAPLWGSVIVGGVLLFLFPAWEVVLGAFLLDALYSSGDTFLSIPFPLTVISILLLVALHPFRSALARR